MVIITFFFLIHLKKKNGVIKWEQFLQFLKKLICYQ